MNVHGGQRKTEVSLSVKQHERAETKDWNEEELREGVRDRAEGVER